MAHYDLAMMDDGQLVDVRSVTRRFDSGSDHPVVALDGVSLQVARGEILGLLGPNGAGKTTLIKILATVLLPSGGTARVGGYDVVTEASTVRRQVGIVFGGDRGLYDRLTAQDNLEFWAALYGFGRTVGRERAVSLLHRVGLANHATRPVETLSRGMKQRLHLARGLVGTPQVLLLDEPTSGLDPGATLAFRELVAELRADGCAILLATHDMVEAETVCDRVAMINEGRIVAMASPGEVRSLIGGERIEVDEAPADLEAVVRGLSGVTDVTFVQPARMRVHVADRAAAAGVLEVLVARGLTRIATGPPSLEEAYLHFVGKRELAV